jgi:hypothetical protein
MVMTVSSRDARLERLVGTWETRGEVVGDEGATTASIEGTDSYEWLGQETLVHRADVRMGEKRVRVFEVIGPYDAERGGYSTRVYGNEAEPQEWTARVDARGVWRFETAGARGTLWIDRGGRTMRAEWLRTDDAGATWHPWMHLRFTRRVAGR